MGDDELQRMVQFLVRMVRQRVDDDAPIARESMDAIREAARVTHAAWKARSEEETPIVLTGLSVGGVTIDFNETFYFDYLDEIFSSESDLPSVDDAALEKKREERWREKQIERAEKPSKTSVRIVLALLVFVVGVGIVIALREHFAKEHETPHDKAEMKR